MGKIVRSKNKKLLRTRPWYKLHSNTVFLLLLVTLAIATQFAIIGKYYWSGSALAINMLYGAIILFVAALLSELRIRRKSTLFAVHLSSLIIMLFLSGILIWLNTTRRGPIGDVTGNEIFLYGFPVIVAREHDKVVTFLYRDLWINILFFIVFLAVAAVVLERAIKFRGVNKVTCSQKSHPSMKALRSKKSSKPESQKTEDSTQENRKNSSEVRDQE